ncbi:MAG: ABC transporter substrate-binding protein [Hyphomicrobiaceae bacterium]|nr:ABC transporter substrate-binding protein [Hyphomicrobiaceae bacterium]
MDFRALVAGVVAGLIGATHAGAQDSIKIGLILPYSGQFADTASQLESGIKLYIKQHGAAVAGRKIELLRRDTGGVAPDVARRLAQELVLRDNVDVLAGFVLSPNTLAAADVSAAAKKLMVVMNAGASIITTKSPYATRTSVTLPQVSEAFGAWAARSGIKKAYSMVSDFAPGHDAEAGFQRAFTAAGGEMVGSVRFPVVNPDFSAFVQRAKDVNPQAIFLFIPAGAQPAAFGKAIAERGIDPNKTRILGTGETTSEGALKSMGDTALGIITAWNYDYNQDSQLNQTFVKEYNEAFRRNPDFTSVGGYDGMHLIYEALKKAGGNSDGEALITAVKGLAWESPRGPVAIDPDTRDIVQTIYIRRVEKVGDSLRNVVFGKVENVKDPVLARMKN